MDLLPAILPTLVIFAQIVVIDVALAGDNAVAIGMSAAGLPPENRHKAILRGITIAAVLRIIFAVFAVKLLHIAGLVAAGGLLLLWVAWKMYGEIRHAHRVHNKKPEDIVAERPGSLPRKTVAAAVIQIAVTDISMSLDNVLAVAGVARGHTIALVFGLALSVLLMGVAAALLARLITRHRWIAWLGLAIVLYTALAMTWEGWQEMFLR